MAIISNGILGSFSGKVGSVVGGSWRGIQYIRSLPKKVKRVPTEKMLNQQAKFALAMSFVNPLRSFLKENYEDEKIRYMTSANLLSSHILRHAVQGNLPEIKLNYSKIIISKGTVEQLLDISSEKLDRVISVKWGAEEKYLVPLAEVEVRGVIYNENKNHFHHFKLGSRKTAQGEISLSLFDKGEKLAIWLYTMDKKTNRISESQFINEFTV
ncbi:hypothetical protein SMI01S_29660 [Sphingobacterium mizutaii NBRC 14946 = DSM 11724]|uniref:Uncharacterized protein n=2 Tax=Sphingobacterium mizutaii TaxID=1010 RepID=A0AAJ5C0P5_9SPHI|nr:DUF6266 family protein [Sphingobacterium mizutaii]GEM69360.1 hypothetical protein SMI01S_29660 [Sphingobacterium mizutaii NBRC 14946 = DSM 11724]SDL12140.1 hypothetical protein SAMN05192578_1011389 [Sphingobacterium mizutaii]SNV51720.1 Uncharacterised protein [Sphingobacterium mizutaii]